MPPREEALVLESVTRPAPQQHVVTVCLVGLGGALCLRLAVAGPAGIRSASAGLAFATALLLVAGCAGVRLHRLAMRNLTRGLLGAALLCVGPVVARTAHGFLPATPGLLQWVPMVVLVAVTEELLLRGVLFSALEQQHGATAAVLLTSVVFALMHVPLYGWQVVPLDLLVGVWLGLIRLWDGSAAAPAVAHAAADVAGWWLR